MENGIKLHSVREALPDKTLGEEAIEGDIALKNNDLGIVLGSTSDDQTIPQRRERDTDPSSSEIAVKGTDYSRVDACDRDAH